VEAWLINLFKEAAPWLKGIEDHLKQHGPEVVAKLVIQEALKRNAQEAIRLQPGATDA
jgi:gluconate kinase